MSLRFLYETVPGRVILKILTAPFISKAAGAYLNTGLSKGLIKGFISRNNIDMSEYEDVSFKCFNDFFCREIKPGMRRFSLDPEDLTAPCDGLLSCYRIKEDTVIPVKQSEYKISDLLENESLAKEFYNGSCLVYRLCVNHYHRYSFFDDCSIQARKFIKGVLHTVRPVALENVPVFVRNSREYTLLDTGNFGRAVQMEVGAMLVGKIDNYYSEGSFKRGQQKGRFLYGGSTIIVLLREGAATVREDILMNTSEYKETPVKMGEVVGRAQALS